MSIEQNNTLRDANYSEDEISLYDLYKVLVKRKLLIFIIIALSLVLCVIYLLVAPKIYQETAVLLPPTSGDVYLTNIDIANVTDFKPERPCSVAI
jgi:LPS O-antigen subunit length determinant protein (WzzB/FepE family)